MADRWPTSRQPSVVLDHRAVQHENALLRELVTVYQHLTGLTLQDADVSTVTRLLAERTAATVAVVSRGLDVLAAAAADAAGDVTEQVRVYLSSPRLAAVLNSTAQTRRSLRLPDVGDAAGVIVAPILVGDDVPAYLMTFGTGQQGDGGDMSLLVTEHAATICGVILGRERVVAAAARQVRDDLVEGLLLGSGREDGEVGRWARHLGYDSSRDHRIVAVAFEAAASARAGSTLAEAAVAQAKRVAAAVDHFFTTRVPGAISSIREDEVVVVMPEGSRPHRGAEDAARMGASCLARMRDLFPETVITIGIGGACRDPADIARSYGQARRTIDAVVRLGRQGQVVAFEDLGIHRLLLQVPELAELRSFATEILGKLGGQERQRGTELLTTLACYFRENNSPQRTARSLHVHPNTVAYRIRRIQEITGLQLGSYRDRLMAQVALEIIDALGTGLDVLPVGGVAAPAGNRD
ncbi:MAG TPA: helix-turn-helix domain-containing protein [Streptosporangiaceae bacterium]|jgi:sugar diacid utilization regulator|nr:helix-turn-helix domain-containing protein [Streptosporangiaceae bacterium]